MLWSHLSETSARSRGRGEPRLHLLSARARAPVYGEPCGLQPQSGRCSQTSSQSSGHVCPPSIMMPSGCGSDSRGSGPCSVRLLHAMHILNRGSWCLQSLHPLGLHTSGLVVLTRWQFGSVLGSECSEPGDLFCSVLQTLTPDSGVHLSDCAPPRTCVEPGTSCRLPSTGLESAAPGRSRSCARSPSSLSASLSGCPSRYRVSGSCSARHLGSYHTCDSSRTPWNQGSWNSPGCWNWSLPVSLLFAGPPIQMLRLFGDWVQYRWPLCVLGPSTSALLHKHDVLSGCPGFSCRLGPP